MKFDPGLTLYTLKPTEFIFVREPSAIRTILGSCVTITMFCPRLGVAAACHPVLPVCHETESCRPKACKKKYKYVECVIPSMYQYFERLKVRKGELEIKLFGGSDMFTPLPVRDEMLSVGSKNISMAKQKIAELEIELKNTEVGGKLARKIHFDTGSGDVWVKKFRSTVLSKNNMMVLEEQIAMQVQHHGK